MQLKYDLHAGALYIRLTDHAVTRTRELGDNANVDLDAAGDVVGVEVISIAYPWPLDEFLASYDIPASEAVQFRAYFRPGPMVVLPHVSTERAPAISAAAQTRPARDRLTRLMVARISPSEPPRPGSAGAHWR
jgi:uncharacterized protein YuzE